MNHRDSSPVSRRHALKVLGVTAAVASFGLNRALAESVPAATLNWELPKLPYAYNALEPHFDARTMEIHHTKHHQAYITNAKNLLKDHPDLLARGPEALVKDLASVPEGIRSPALIVIADESPSIRCGRYQVRAWLPAPA